MTEITEVKYSAMHLVPLFVKSTMVTQNDWVTFSQVKGVLPFKGMAASVALSLQETFTWGVFRINGTISTTTGTTIVGSSCTLGRVVPYYIITAGGEIMEVESDSDVTSASPTVVVKRGCLGTTASTTGLATTNYCGIMNQLKLGANTVGPHLWVVLTLPNDVNAKVFA